jgi:hypothetical protein
MLISSSVFIANGLFDLDLSGGIFGSKSRFSQAVVI